MLNQRDKDRVGDEPVREDPCPFRKARFGKMFLRQDYTRYCRTKLGIISRGPQHTLRGNAYRYNGAVKAMPVFSRQVEPHKLNDHKGQKKARLSSRRSGDGDRELGSLVHSDNVVEAQALNPLLDHYLVKGAGHNVRR